VELEELPPKLLEGAEYEPPSLLYDGDELLLRPLNTELPEL
jgi:hypothetical protein